MQTALARPWPAMLCLAANSLSLIVCPAILSLVLLSHSNFFFLSFLSPLLRDSRTFRLLSLSFSCVVLFTNSQKNCSPASTIGYHTRTPPPPPLGELAFGTDLDEESTPKQEAKTTISHAHRFTYVRVGIGKVRVRGRAGRSPVGSSTILLPISGRSRVRRPAQSSSASSIEFGPREL